MVTENIDVKAQIIKLITSEAYIKLQEYYASTSLFNIIKKERSETVHSNILYWLFNPESNHGLSFYPITSLLLLLCHAKDENYNSECSFNPDYERSFIIGNYEIHSADVIREKNTGKSIAKGKRDKYGLVDLVIELDITINHIRKILPIIIENKVGGNENDYTPICGLMQTEFYHEWGKIHYADTNKYFQPLYVYLQVKLEKTKYATDKSYINIFYQELEDLVLAPCLNQRISSEGMHTLKEYIRCLSYSSTKDTDNNAKGVYIMGFSPEERTYLKEFYEANRELILSMASCLQDDDDLDEEEQNSLKALSITMKDYQEYKFDGNDYRKGRLVLAVIKKYISDNPSIDINELQSTFPHKGITPYEIVKLKEDLTPKEDGTIGNKRFFIDDEIPLASGKSAVVCKEWGKDNIGKFIKLVEDKILPSHPEYLIELKK